jgi:stress response protein YsnF
MTTTEPEGSGPPRASSPGPAEVVRSEEQLRVGTRTEVSGRVRIRKVVTSREVTQTFTLRREELVVEHLPADGAALEVPAGGSSPADLELVLHEEQLVVVPVPVERVRVRVERVRQDVVVSEALRREQVEVDVDPADPAAG